MANTRSGARQLVSHKHITVSGKVVNIPSFSLNPGDIISDLLTKKVQLPRSS